MLKSIHLTNFLSYGENSRPIELRPLNVLIGPNGSGKSNLIEALELIHAAPRDVLKPIREGGGAHEWLWKGAASSLATATIDVVVERRESLKPGFTSSIEIHLGLPPSPSRYVISFPDVGEGFIDGERLESERPNPGHEDEGPYIYYNFQRGNPVINMRNLPTQDNGAQDTGNLRELKHFQHGDVNRDASVLSQYKGVHYPELTGIGNAFDGIRIYREWSFGRYTIPRLPQKADLPNYRLEPDAGNLVMVLNRMHGEPEIKKRLLESLNALYEGIDDFHVHVEGGTVQVFFQEGKHKIPATRLSDGTLRYLCLLAILCHPDPGPLVCIEEPELGLHPDVLPTLSKLMLEASERTQLIVTTHSDILVDAFHYTPEVVLVTEKTEHGTQVERLDAKEFKHWLDKYRLGELWLRGDIGGNRW